MLLHSFCSWSVVASESVLQGELSPLFLFSVFCLQVWRLELTACLLANVEVIRMALSGRPCGKCSSFWELFLTRNNQAAFSSATHHQARKLCKTHVDFTNTGVDAPGIPWCVDMDVRDSGRSLGHKSSQQFCVLHDSMEFCMHQQWLE